MHKAYYRQYRPKTFNEVVGQMSIISTITSQISSNKIGHAYLFIGTRGTGKTTVSKIFARALNCENRVDDNPCNTCESCLSSLNDSSMDIIEMDAASNNGVDDIRELKEITKFPPAKGKYKIIIIDEVHMLSKGAFNALLKTLEEPPSFVVFILATTEPNKVPVTIVSRCQRYEFKRIENNIIVEHLKLILSSNDVPFEETALDYIATLSEGGLRDALSLLEQCVSFARNRVTLIDVMDLLGTAASDTYNELLNSVIEQDMQKLVNVLKELYKSGVEASLVLRNLIEYTQRILHNTFKKQNELFEIKKSMSEVKTISSQDYLKMIVELLTAFISIESAMRSSSYPWIVLESRLVKITIEVGQSDLQPPRALRYEIQETNRSPRDIKSPTRPVQELTTVNNESLPLVSKTQLPQEMILQSEMALQSEADLQDLSIEMVIQKWETYLQHIKKKLVSTYALMREVKPVAIENGTLKVYLNENLRILKQAIENEDNMAHIMSSFKEVFQASVKVVFIDEIVDNSEEARIVEFFSTVVKASNITIK